MTSSRKPLKIENWDRPPEAPPSKLTRTYRATTKAKKETGYAGGLELKIAQALEASGLIKGKGFRYEPCRIPFKKPSTTAHYKPDFILENGIIIEGKGRFASADRQKHLLVQVQHPGLDVRFVFSNPNTRIGKGSATTYAMWCDRNGFKYAKGSPPVEWLKEPPEPGRLKALEAFMHGKK